MNLKLYRRPFLGVLDDSAPIAEAIVLMQPTGPRSHPGQSFAWCYIARSHHTPTNLIVLPFNGDRRCWRLLHFGVHVHMKRAGVFEDLVLTVHPPRAPTMRTKDRNGAPVQWGEAGVRSIIVHPGIAGAVKRAVHSFTFDPSQPQPPSQKGSR